MDMEGRSLGTERPSVSTGGMTEAQAPRFADLLSSRAGAVRRESKGSVEDRMAARIRDGRTDAARVDDSKRDVIRESQTPDADVQGPRERPEGRFSEPAAGESARTSAQPPGVEGTLLSGQLASHGRAGVGGAVSAQDADDEASDPSDALAPDAPIRSIIARPENGAFGLAAAGARPNAGPRSAPSGGGGSPVGGSLVPGAARAATGANAQVRPGAEVGAVSSASRKAPKAASAQEAPRAGSTERAEAILDQLKVKIMSGAREARLQLRPRDLGLIDMRIRVEGGGVQAQVLAESPETLAVLEAHVPELRAWIAREGGGPVEIQLGLLDAQAGEAQADSDGGREADAGSGGKGSGRHSAGGYGVTAQASSALTSALQHTTNNDGVDLVA